MMAKWLGKGEKITERIGVLYDLNKCQNCGEYTADVLKPVPYAQGYGGPLYLNACGDCIKLFERKGNDYAT